MNSKNIITVIFCFTTLKYNICATLKYNFRTTLKYKYSTAINYNIYTEKNEYGNTTREVSASIRNSESVSG